MIPHIALAVLCFAVAAQVETMRLARLLEEYATLMRCKRMLEKQDACQHYWMRWVPNPRGEPEFCVLCNARRWVL